MLWPWRRFKGIKMNHRWPPGNTRSSLNGTRSSCTLGGRKGSEGKQQLVGEMEAGERDTALGLRLAPSNHCKGTNPKACETMLVSCGVPQGGCFVFFFLELPLVIS